MYLKSKLTVFIQFELNNDTLIEIVLSLFEWVDRSTHGDCAILTKHLLDFLRTNSRAIFALKEEKTYPEVSM